MYQGLVTHTLFVQDHWQLWWIVIATQFKAFFKVTQRGLMFSSPTTISRWKREFLLDALQNPPKAWTLEELRAVMYHTPVPVFAARWHWQKEPHLATMEMCRMWIQDPIWQSKYINKELSSHNIQNSVHSVNCPLFFNMSKMHPDGQHISFSLC